MKNQGLQHAILVKDDSIRNFYCSDFYQFLCSEGFELWTGSNYPPCSWVYISMNTKQYMVGIPGASVTSVLGHQAITIEEFMKIYEIYKKYEEISILDFSEVDVIERNEVKIGDVVLFSESIEIVLEYTVKPTVSTDNEVKWCKHYRLSLRNTLVDSPVRYSISGQLASDVLEHLYSDIEKHLNEGENADGMGYSFGKWEVFFVNNNQQEKRMLFMLYFVNPDASIDNPSNYIMIEFGADMMLVLRDFLREIV